MASTKRIAEIYRHYDLMPQLVAHQLRVAAVAKSICDAMPNPLHVPEVISACLLHDMGNILKFDLSYFPQFLEPQGRAYWEGVKERFKAQYGPDEHDATLAIAQEVGVSETTLSYIRAVGFGQAVSNLAAPELEKKVCCYADVRVAPMGIVSMQERLAEGDRRYAKHPRRDKPLARDAYVRAFAEIEAEIFSRASILPEDITEASTRAIQHELKFFEVI